MRRLLFAILMVTAACAGEDDRPARWSFIQPSIIQPNCATARCHTKFTATAGLRFDSIDDSYAYLVTGDLVVPFRPQDSKLMFLLRGDETWRMPPDAPLPDPDIELIQDWILAGAMKN